MKIGAISNFNRINNLNAFRGRQNLKETEKPAEIKVKHDKENPISKPLEQLDVFKATLIAGLSFGARAVYYIFEDTSLLDYTYDAGRNLARKNYKGATDGKLFALGIASWAAILIGIIGALAALYAAYNAPKSMYQGKINAHKKAEEMDIYLEGNRIEQELYSEVGKKAKEAKTTEEMEAVKKQAMVLRASKNEVPSFVKFQNSFKNPL